MVRPGPGEHLAARARGRAVAAEVAGAGGGDRRDPARAAHDDACPSVPALVKDSPAADRAVAHEGHGDQIARGHALDAGQADVDPGVRIPLTAALPKLVVAKAKTLPSSLRARA